MKGVKVVFAIVVVAVSLAIASFGRLYDWKDKKHVVFEEPQFSFGKIGPGDTARHSFAFTNIGKTPVHVARVQSSCGCVADGTVRQVVNPGESGCVTITLSTRGIEPPCTVNKQLLVFFEQEDIKPMFLTVLADVVPPIAVEPSHLRFTEDALGVLGTQEMKVRNELLPPQVFRTVNVVTTEPYYLVHDMTRLEGAFRASLTFLPDRAPVSLAPVLVRYRKDGCERTVSVPVEWKRVDGVGVVPSSYVAMISPSISERSLRNETKRRFVLTSAKHPDLEVTDISMASKPDDVFQWLMETECTGAGTGFSIWVHKVPVMSSEGSILSALLRVRFREKQTRVEGQILLKAYLLVAASKAKDWTGFGSYGSAENEKVNPRSD
jgi:hypothetical protein